MLQMNKYSKKLNNISKKYLKKVTLQEYLNDFKRSYYISNLMNIKNTKNIIITTSYIRNNVLRHNMVNTLKEINYKRLDNKWCTSTVIPFMQEVMDYNFNNSEEDTLEDISTRYNVPKYRINTQMALFIRNYEKGVDKFNISKYFNTIDIFKWKYRDIEKLKEDMELDKISNEMLTIVHQYYNI